MFDLNNILYGSRGKQQINKSASQEDIKTFDITQLQGKNGHSKNSQGRNTSNTLHTHFRNPQKKNQLQVYFLAQGLHLKNEKVSFKCVFYM